MTLARPIAHSILAALSLALTACGASRRELTVAVRDATTKQPIPDARVRVQPVHLFLPSQDGSSGSILNPSQGAGISLITDESGCATGDLYLGHPMRLVVVPPNRPAEVFTTTYESKHIGEGEWISPESSVWKSDDRETIEISLSEGAGNSKR